MENLFMIVMAIGVYAALLFVFWHIGDKVGARSRMFAVGLANTVTGFLLDRVVIMCCDFRIFYNVRFDEDLFALVTHSMFLILVLSGIIILAIELTKAFNELHSILLRSGEKSAPPKSTPGSSVQSHPEPQGHIPMWKRIQMEQEEK